MRYPFHALAKPAYSSAPEIPEIGIREPVAVSAPTALPHLSEFHDRHTSLTVKVDARRNVPRVEGGHHPVGEHRPGSTGAQQVGMVDVGSASDDGMNQGQNLPAPVVPHPLGRRDARTC